jgi:hypothetical protein
MFTIVVIGVSSDFELEQTSTPSNMQGIITEKEKLCTTDLLVLTILYQLLFYWKFYLAFYKTS